MERDSFPLQPLPSATKWEKLIQVWLYPSLGWMLGCSKEGRGKTRDWQKRRINLNGAVTSIRYYAGGYRLSNYAENAGNGLFIFQQSWEATNWHPNNARYTAWLVACSKTGARSAVEKLPGKRKKSECITPRLPLRTNQLSIGQPMDQHYLF